MAESDKATGMQKIKEKLNEYLWLQSPPVAIAMLESETAISSDIDTKRVSMPVCQGLAQCRRYGSKILMGPEEMSCPIAAVSLGFAPAKPKFLEGSLEIPRWMGTREARSKFARQLPKLEYGKYALMVSAPLVTADFEPDLVLIYGNAAQISRLVQSCTYMTGEPVVSSSTGAASCAAYISKALLTGQCQLVLPGAGERIFALTQDSEVCFSIPMAGMEAVLKGLKDTHDWGVRYPVKSYLKYQPEMPGTYKEMMGHLRETV